jgi:hypothetical protein
MSILEHIVFLNLSRCQVIAGQSAVQHCLQQAATRTHLQSQLVVDTCQWLHESKLLLAACEEKIAS